MSVSCSGLEAEVVAWSEGEGRVAATVSTLYGKKVTSCTVKKEESSDGYVHSVETGGDEENRTVDVITEREKNTVLILIRLAEQEDSS